MMMTLIMVMLIMTMMVLIMMMMMIMVTMMMLVIMMMMLVIMLMMLVMMLVMVMIMMVNIFVWFFRGLQDKKPSPVRSLRELIKQEERSSQLILPVKVTNVSPKTPNTSSKTNEKGKSEKTSGARRKIR